MARDLTAGVVTGLEAGVVRQVLIGRFDILTDPLVAWTGPGTFAPVGTGDAALDGQIFVNLAPFIEMTGITEDQGIGGSVTLTVSGHDLDFDLLKQIVRDQRQWRGRSAWLWMGLLNADESTVISSPPRIKTGVMTQMMVKRSGEEASVSITIDKDLGRSRSVPWRWIDHTRIYAADTFSSFVIELANKPEGLVDPRLNQDPLDDARTDGDAAGDNRT